MTIIQEDVEVAVRTLMNAGFSGYRISKELGLKESTVYPFMKKVHKMYKGKIQGPMQLNIKRYLAGNPSEQLSREKSFKFGIC